MLATLKKNKWSCLAVAGVVLLLILLPSEFLLGQKISLLTMVGIYSIVTVGLCLLMGYTGQVALGQAAFFGLGAYISAVLSTTHNVNSWLAMLIAAVATGAFAYVVGFPILRLRGNYLAMATLGLGVIMWVLFRNLSQYTGGPDGLTGIPDLSIGGFVFDTDLRKYSLIWAFCIVILLISQNVMRSRAGRALRAIHGSEGAAESVGVNVTQFKVKILVLSAVYASLGGSLYAHQTNAIGPGSFDFLASVVILTMAVVGGLASVWGAVFGAAAILLLKIEWIPEMSKISFLRSYFESGAASLIIYGLLLMLVMIFMPKGLFVTLRDAYEHWRLRRAHKEAAA
jgi:branched-chain amino acid transport system permease protein